MKMPLWRRRARAAGRRGKRAPKIISGLDGMRMELERLADEVKKCHENLPTMSQDGRSPKRRKLSDDHQSYVRNEGPQMKPASAGYSSHCPILIDHAEEPENIAYSDIHGEDKNQLNYLDNFHNSATPLPLVQTKDEAGLSPSASIPSYSGPACTSHGSFSTSSPKTSSEQAQRGKGFESRPTMRVRFTGSHDLAKSYDEALSKFREKEERTKIWREIWDTYFGGLARTEGVKESAASCS
jgi:hypothetical protein